MDRYEREELKKKVLALAVSSPIPVNPNYVSEKLGIIYSTAQSLLYDLALEGHLKMNTRGWTRHFVVNLPEQELEVKKK